VWIESIISKGVSGTLMLEGIAGGLLFQLFLKNENLIHLQLLDRWCSSLGGSYLNFGFEAELVDKKRMEKARRKQDTAKENIENQRRKCQKTKLFLIFSKNNLLKHK
jgi:hypothetical protein